MDFKFVNTKITLKEGIAPEKFLANRAVAKNPERIKNMFLEHGYDISSAPGEFIKTLSYDEKEAYELSEVLDEIEQLGLKDVFNANLRPASFKKSFVERVKTCLENHTPFLNSDNTFIRQLNSPDAFKDYTTSMPLKDTEEKIELDMEDTMVKHKIMETLGEIGNDEQNPVLTAIISNIYTHLDEVIKKDEKKYKVMGIRHLVEDALVGEIDPVMQSVFDTKVLVAFPENEMERGL